MKRASHRKRAVGNRQVEEPSLEFPHLQRAAPRSASPESFHMRVHVLIAAINSEPYTNAGTVLSVPAPPTPKNFLYSSHSYMTEKKAAPPTSRVMKREAFGFEGFLYAQIRI